MALYETDVKQLFVIIKELHFLSNEVVIGVIGECGHWSIVQNIIVEKLLICSKINIIYLY